MEEVQEVQSRVQFKAFGETTYLLKNSDKIDDNDICDLFKLYEQKENNDFNLGKFKENHEKSNEDDLNQIRLEVLKNIDKLM